MYAYYYKVNINASAVITSARIKAHLKYGHGFIGVSPRRKANVCLHFFPGLKISTMMRRSAITCSLPAFSWPGLIQESRAAVVVSVVCFWALGELLRNPLGVPSGRAGGSLASCCGSLRGSFSTLVACHAEHHRQPSSWKGVVIKALDSSQPASVHCEPGLYVHKWPDLNTRWKIWDWAPTWEKLQIKTENIKR